jgi:hypothetical protein
MAGLRSRRHLWYIGTVVPQHAFPVATFLCAALWSTQSMTAPPTTQVRSFHLDASRERVFPLFTALGERAWAPGWEPVILSGAEERGSAFRTRDPHGRETTWVVTDYRPSEGRVSYARLAENSNIGLVDVICTVSPAGGTDVSVRYTLTPVSQQGRPFVQEFLSDTHYTQMIDEWRSAVSTALGASSAVR